MFDIIKCLYGCKNIYGPYIGQDGRQRCVLYFEKGQTTSRSYAKLQLEAKLGRKLTSFEEADHLDNDKTNDEVNNLQILSREDNLLKQQYWHAINATVYGYICSVCETPFLLSERDRNQRIAQSSSGLAFCSSYCSNIHRTQQNSLSVERINSIRDNLRQGLSVLEVAKIVGVSDWTVRKYR